MCSAPMPAGKGHHCDDCYWLNRCARSAAQLVELLRTKRARDAFAAFAAWLPYQGYAQKAALGLRKHVLFFELLDTASDEVWTGDFLLARLGPATLRKYELPVRWLQAERGVTLDAQDKASEAEKRRIGRSIDSMPAGSVARRVLEQFEQELKRRQDAGKLAERSMRLAFRPALVLLALEDADGTRLPSQATLERYLANTPGQRAAVSTFVGFLKVSRGIELQLPAKQSGNSVSARKSLEKQINALMASTVSPDAVAKRWTQLALRYFHHLSTTDAKKILAEAASKTTAGGTVLTYEGLDYWVPSEPAMHSRTP